MQLNLGFLILAAGQGKRMFSERPKTLHTLCGKSLIHCILETIYKTFPNPHITVVIGHQHERVQEHIEKFFPAVFFVKQLEQKGTAHAVMEAFSSDLFQNFNQICILSGDTPLITKEFLECLCKPFKNEFARFVTCEKEDPKGYGRVLRKNQKVLKIVEEQDATLLQKKIKEVSISIYIFKTAFLKENLPTLSKNNAQNELYLTDLIEIAAQKNSLSHLAWEESNDLLGINTLWELSFADDLLRLKLLKEWSNKGVHFIDPKTVQMDLDVTFESQAVIYSHVQLKGKCHIGKNVVIESHSFLENAIIEEETLIQQGTIIKDSEVGAHCTIGPYAHLRPQSVIKNQVRIGNFVETKKSFIDDNTKIAHLSYVGDATIGKNVNIGCGFITCNYDGKKKWQTLIKDNVFIGADCQIVAPCTIEENAWIASGSTITKNVPKESLAIARSHQVLKVGYSKKYRK